MKAVGKYIVVEDLKEKTSHTKGGLILNQSNREDIRYVQAKILVTGDFVEAIKKDDVVFYDKHAGFMLEVDKKSYKVIKEQDVVIVL